MLAFIQLTTIEKETKILKKKLKKSYKSSSNTENKGFEPLRQLPDLTI